MTSMKTSNSENIGYRELLDRSGNERQRFIDFFDRQQSSEFPSDLWGVLGRNAYLQEWGGVVLNKGPMEIAIYPMLINELRPKTIIELGALNGGSAKWFADLTRCFEIDTRVISVDIDLSLLHSDVLEDQRITFVEGDCNEIERVLPARLLESYLHPWLIIEDSHVNTIGVMNYFHENGLRQGDYMIIEDTNDDFRK